MSSHNVQMKRWISGEITTECHLMEHFNQGAVVELNDNCYLQQTISTADDNSVMRWANERDGGVH